jgi:DNA polymerase III epsilon subunit-like protein
VRPAADERLVFVDLEVGKAGRQRLILQIAAVALTRSLVELESFEAKILTDVPRDAEIRHRRFNRAQWQAEAKHPKVVAYEFGRFLGRHATVEIAGTSRRRIAVAQLVAHNAEFDGLFLRDWFERLGLFLPASYRVHCTLQRALWLFQEQSGMIPPADFKLGTLCRYFGIMLPLHEAHDALADVRATAELYRRMMLLNAARLAQNAIPLSLAAPTKGCG